jgi:hypothetical protein
MKEAAHLAAVDRDKSHEAGKAGTNPASEEP